MGGNVTWMHAGCCETTCQIRCNRWQQSRTSWPLTSKQNRYENMTCNLSHRKPRNDQQMTNQMTKTWQTNDKKMTKKWPKNDPKMHKKCQHKFKTTNRIQKNDKKMTKKWQNNYFGFSNVCRPKIFLRLHACPTFVLHEMDFPKIGVPLNHHGIFPEINHPFGGPMNTEAL